MNASPINAVPSSLQAVKALSHGAEDGLHAVVFFWKIHVSIQGLAKKNTWGSVCFVTVGKCLLYVGHPCGGAEGMAPCLSRCSQVRREQGRLLSPSIHPTCELQAAPAGLALLCICITESFCPWPGGDGELYPQVGVSVALQEVWAVLSCAAIGHQLEGA